MKSTKNLIIAIFATVSLSAFAGWEDIGVTRQAPVSNNKPAAAKPARAQAKPVKQASNHPAPRPENKPASGAYLLPPDLYSAFLDTPKSKPNNICTTYVLSSDADKTKEAFSEAIIDGSFEIVTFEDIISGDISLSFDPSLTFFPNDAGIKHLPSMLVKLALDIDWIWRYTNGWSFELGGTPGIYADIDGFGSDMFAIPFRGIFYYAVDPTFSIKFGAECRLGWDQVIMPHVGLAWQPDDQFRLELAVPRTIANINVGIVDIFGKIEWQNATYAMAGGNDDLDDFTLNEWKLGGGVGIDISDSSRLILEGGLMFGREITVTKGSKEYSTDVDSSVYLGIALGWDM